MRSSNWVRLVLVGLGAVALFAALFWTTEGVQVATPRELLTDVARTPKITTTPTALSSAGAEAAGPAVPAAQSSATPTALDSAGPALFPALPALTPPAEGAVHSIAPEADAVGWAQQGDDVANHLGDYNVYAGVFDGQAHVGLIQFDLSGVAPGAPVLYADLALVGLSDKWLGQGGTWQVDLLEPWLGEGWRARTYGDVAGEEGVALALAQTLAAEELGVGQANLLVLDDEARGILEEQVLSGWASFRVTGPAEGEDNLFAWDSGYGPKSEGWAPVLRLVTGRAPEHPPPTSTPYYVIITSTPTPANLVTAAARAGTATAQATLVGTPTPLPPHWATPVIVAPTSTPANEATAQWHAALGTAQASLYGTPTPWPPNVWTVTPTPTPWFLVVTNTPTPANWATAIARAEAEATRLATAGPPTPLPAYMVTATPLPTAPPRGYVLVTSTPTPANYATAAARSAQATIVALSTGTYTPVPRNWATATPVPLLIPEAWLTATPRPTTTPRPWVTPIPAALRGKIIFQSDRLSGSVDEPSLFVMDPDGGNVALLTQQDPYQEARRQMPFSADGVRQILVQPNDKGVPQLYLQDLRYNVVRRPITSFTALAYGPAWAPDRDVIAFVSADSGNDEIYTINLDGSDLQQLTWNTWEWDKHPSWSPDGEQIVFYSNRWTGRRQIWIMEADGSKQRNLSNNEWNDWDPVWVR